MAKIEAKTRKLLGKKAKRLNNDGYIPGVVYDNKTNSKSIKLEKGEVIKLLREATSTTIVDINLDGKEVKAFVKAVDFDPIYDEPQHIAFFEIDETSELTIGIPVVLKGISPAVKNNLGVLITPMTSIEVKCKLSNLINEIEIDISKLTTPGQTITVGDIELPEGMELLHKEITDTALVSIAEVQKAIVDTPEETAEGAEADELAEAEEA